MAHSLLSLCRSLVQAAGEAPDGEVGLQDGEQALGRLQAQLMAAQDELASSQLQVSAASLSALTWPYACPCNSYSSQRTAGDRPNSPAVLAAKICGTSFCASRSFFYLAWDPHARMQKTTREVQLQ
eukprot:jgi/Mesen1/1584/ME000134S00705